MYNTNDNIDINNLRFWVFFSDKLSIVSMNDSLEELGIVNRAIVLIEEKYDYLMMLKNFYYIPPMAMEKLELIFQ